MRFSAGNDIRITVDSDSTAVRKAVSDLKRDLTKLLPSANVIFSDGGDILIGTAENSTYRGIAIKNDQEMYTVFVSDKNAIIAGSDELGTVYGIYRFEKEFLGIDPMFLLNGLFPESADCLITENKTVFSDERKVKFRGWFFNDEDLLTDFKPGGGKRNIDYPFYENVMNGYVLDTVLETALRNEINLVIPSSFVDIDNPDEERLVSMTAERGLYITQHHIEPMGVSYFGAENYMKKHGIPGDVSFVSNRDVMIGIWRHYAEKWAKYGKNVIWQLGLRGKADRAVWQNDPSVGTDEISRGKIISDAIMTQYKIVRETVGSKSFLSTSTLWLEGAELYGKGHLKIPTDTFVIFSDVGLNQMFSDDLYTTQHKLKQKYGVYYHAAFWSRGPHLAEGCNPLKMLFSYREAAKNDCLSYSILNVSNLREVHLSARINAEILKDPLGFDLDDFLNDIFSSVFGNMSKKMLGLYYEYFRCFADLGDELLKANGKNFYLREYKDLPFINFAADDGMVRHIAINILSPEEGILAEKVNLKYLLPLEKSEENFTVLLSKLDGVSKDIPKKAVKYFEIFPHLQTEYMLYITRWSISIIKAALQLKKGEMLKAKELLIFAVNCLEKIMTARTCAAKDEFEGWYNGDKKINIPSLIEITKNAEKRLS